jgi:hypothetical protein
MPLDGEERIGFIVPPRCIHSEHRITRRATFSPGLAATVMFSAFSQSPPDHLLPVM